MALRPSYSEQRQVTFRKGDSATVLRTSCKFAYNTDCVETLRGACLPRRVVQGTPPALERTTARPSETGGIAPTLNDRPDDLCSQATPLPHEMRGHGCGSGLRGSQIQKRRP